MIKQIFPGKELLWMQLKRPIVWFAFAFFLLGIYRNASVTGFQSRSINSDGRGYYAYLPAYFLYDDPTFQKSLKAEMDYFHQTVPSQYYIFKDPKGIYYNKYFPGVSIFQAPFFGMAVIANKIVGKVPTGYSHTFSNFFYLGHLVYSILGMLLFVSCLKQLFPTSRYIEWKVIAFYLATPLLYYSVEIPLSHNYTFLLFGMFTWLVLKGRKQWKYNYFFLIGLILGWITIVRPTNFLVVLITPFLLGGWQETKELFQMLFANWGKRLITLIIGFLIPIFFLLVVIQWQTGEWFFWPYSGEGFNWTKPMIWQQLFSFRTGIFLHTPIVILAVIGAFWMLKKNQFATGFWFLYFAVNTYVIASWWCWDYASLMGARPYTEHLFFILMPLIPLMDRLPKLMFLLVLFTVGIGSVRYLQIVTAYMNDQRFTRENYLESLMIWKRKNYGRWNFTQSCEPFGKVIDYRLIADYPEELKVTPEMEFIYTKEIEIGYDHLDERGYVMFEMEKRVDDEVPFEEVFVVIDTHDSNGNTLFYFPQPLYNDKYEAHGTWKKIVLADFVQDNFSQCNRISVYIWNKGKRSFSLRNFKVTYRNFKG